MKGFWSYAKTDDSSGKVSALKVAFEQALNQAFGKKIKVYQDTTGTRWGRKWKDTIDSELKDSKFLVAVMTPSYFNRKYCQYEFDKALHLRIPVLPIYYRRAHLLEGKKRRDDSKEAIEMARKAAELQYRDFRELRNNDIKSKEVQSFIDYIAEELADQM